MEVKKDLGGREVSGPWDKLTFHSRTVRACRHGTRGAQRSPLCSVPVLLALPSPALSAPKGAPERVLLRSERPAHGPVPDDLMVRMYSTHARGMHCPCSGRNQQVVVSDTIRKSPARIQHQRPVTGPHARGHVPGDK